MFTGIGIGLFAGGISLQQQVAAILQKYGTDAHVYLPGIGVINGLTAGNYLDSAGTTAATVDNPVGLVVDSGGINAIQATTANKPILRRGAVNLLLQSETFQITWALTGSSILVNQIASPDGNTTAEFLLEDGTAAGNHRVSQVNSVTSGTTYTLSCFFKKGTRQFIQLFFPTADFGANAYANFDVNLGVVGTKGSAATSSIVSYPNGWYRCIVSAPATATNANSLSLIQIVTSGSAVRSETYNGDGTSGIYVWGAQLETGSTASTYIPTTTAAASSATGNYHWVHDSTDVLTATFPAGYEAATVISTSSTGQNTKEAVNVVGDYKLAGALVSNDLITNAADREFSSDTGYWNKNAGWSITGGKLVAAAAAQYLSTSKASLLTVGKKYLVTLTVELTTGAPAIAAGTTNSANLVAGINRVIIVPATNGTFYITNNSATAFTGTIDNISILEISDKEYGQLIFRTGLTASELTTIQTFANRLAGV